jgi:hypothetical protein
MATASMGSRSVRPERRLSTVPPVTVGGDGRWTSLTGGRRFFDVCERSQPANVAVRALSDGPIVGCRSAPATVPPASAPGGSACLSLNAGRRRWRGRGSATIVYGGATRSPKARSVNNAYLGGPTKQESQQEGPTHGESVSGPIGTFC